MKRDNIKALYKGAIIGGTMLVPGVSGGSMAMILGIYKRLILAVSSFFKNIKENFIFLIAFMLGATTGMLMLAKPLLKLLEANPVTMMYFFIGAVAGGVPMIYKHAKVEKLIWRDVFFIVIGMSIVLLFAVVPKDIFNSSANTDSVNIIIQIIAGFIAAIALVLPGISVSYMLLLMGVYEKTVEAISVFDIGYLMPMAIGLLSGIILITRLLEKAIERHPKSTYLIILGFIIGSMVQVFPGLPHGIDWIFCGVLLIAGFYIINTIAKNE